MSASIPRSHGVTLELSSETATAVLARAVAMPARLGDVIALSGDLGAGKTSFARAFIRELCGRAEEEVPSPSFTLAQVYDCIPVPVWHFDLYRLEHYEEVYELGFEDALTQGISLIEWPGNLGPLLPADRLEVHFDFLTDPNARRAVLSGLGTWAARCRGLGL